MAFTPRASLRLPATLGYAGLCALATVLVLSFADGHTADTAQPPSTFASHVASLSERGGYFDTDNLISNERSYLQVIPDLQRAGIRGGAFVGVGPDTSFSYIADVRPSIAFIVDIRRDNLLLHLLMKSLFEMSATRVEYLTHLLNRPPPPAADGGRTAAIGAIVAHFERARSRPEALAALRQRIHTSIKQTGVPVSTDDLATIDGFHDRFIEAGLTLRFNSTGRAPQDYYPTYGELLLETDAAGRQANYLVSEETFRFLKSMQDRDLIIPVVGDLSGPSALSAIGRLLTKRGERLSAFYASNVEFYLFRQGSFAQFAANLRQMPRTANSTIIRSVFLRYGGAAGRPGDASTSQLHPIEELVTGVAQGRYRSYGELVNR